MQILAHLLLFSAPLHFMPQLHHSKIQLNLCLRPVRLQILTEEVSHDVPLLCIRDFCPYLSGQADSSPIVRDSSRSLANASIIEIVASIALSPFRIVASIYRPFSVNAFGSTDEYLSLSRRSKFLTTSCFSSTSSCSIYPG